MTPVLGAEVFGVAAVEAAARHHHVVEAEVHADTLVRLGQGFDFATGRQTRPVERHRHLHVRPGGTVFSFSGSLRCLA